MIRFSILLILTVCTSAQVAIRGPPQAEQKELKKIGRIGENVRLVCPIGGFPAPMIEWSKNGEKIDYMWERHRTSKKFLKIKNANEDDTGVFTCKGINGFGSEEVRIELIIVDPRKLPKGLNDAENIEVAPPVMTYETRASPMFHTKSIGEMFKVSCEALGSPQPEIFWFKDGQHIDEAVHYQRGKSTVEFSVLGTADAGVYTCRARNLIGEVTQNFTLEVRQPVGATHAIVTEAGPADATVLVGDAAALQCRVKSLAPPHIKWLKRLEVHEVSAENTLRVGNERYRILDSNHDVSTGNDEYLNKLVIDKARLEDSGMYICFVTNSGFGALTYKSMHLTVLEKPIVLHDPVVPTSGHVPNNNNSEEPLPVLILVICLATSVFFLLVIIVVCVVKKKKKESGMRTTAPNTPETQRPFILGGGDQSPLQQQQQQHYLHGVNHKLLSSHKPLPPTPFLCTQWTNSVYPNLTSNPPLVMINSDSGFDNSKELDSSTGNQYEVPYAHLLSGKPSSNVSSGSRASSNNNNNNRRHYLQSSDCLTSSNAYVEPGMATTRSGPASGFSSEHPSYLLKHHKQLQPYFSDYDSQ